MWSRHLSVGCVLGMALSIPAFAQPQIVIPPPKEGKLANLTRVMVPQSRGVALGEMQGLLAFCHDFRHADSHVSLVKLDAKGNPAAYAISWKIPHPKGLEKHPNYAISAAFHPKLPLLYVWQDFNPPPAGPPEIKTFDHLLIYNVAKETPELVTSLGRGDLYPFGFHGGVLAVDPSGEYLYVPNLRDLTNAGILQFGRYKLDADGLPALDEKDAKLPLPARAKQVAALHPSPPQIAPYDHVYLFPMNQWGAGNSFIPLGKEAAIAGAYHGVVSWRPEDKPIQLHGLPLKTRGQHLLGAHPKLPAVFATAYEMDSFSRFEQSDGFVSGLPRQYIIKDEKLTSPPAVLPKSNQLAVGGQHVVYVFNLDEKGYPREEAVKISVYNPQVRSLVYSERFDRLYVGVELSK